MCEPERPREKAYQNGIESLSNRDLIAILLRCGTKGMSVLQLSDELLKSCNTISDLMDLGMNDLLKQKGIKKAKAIQLLASFELSRRIALDQTQKQKVRIEEPQTLASWLNMQIGFCSQEHFLVIFLNTKNEILSYRTLFIGSLNASIVHPREIFKEAIQSGCAKIICAHNHPTGDTQPSDQDIAVTRCIKETGEIIGIPLLDHIIVGRNHYLSLRERQLL